MKHKDCVLNGFTSSVEFVKLLEIRQEDEVKILFRDVCQSCGKEIGREIQRFKHDYTEEVI